MKCIIVIFLVVLCACSKTIDVTKTDLEGTWVLKSITGGFAGIDSLVTERKTIRFETNGTYISTTNASTAEGTYTITKANDYYDYFSETLLNFFINGSKITYGIGLNNDTLGLSRVVVISLVTLTYGRSKFKFFILNF